MDLMILNKEFQNTFNLDVYKSLLWIDRYSECGEFELYTLASSDMLKMIPIDSYIVREDNESVMIVEEIKVSTDTEFGHTLTITGRSLESILDRRIVWEQTTLEGSLEDELERLLNENIISPKIPERRINNFIFEKSEDNDIKELTISKQYTGDYIYDIVVDICKELEIGFRIRLDSDNNYVFKLYKGSNRTYDQTKNPAVVFSSEFDNIVTTDYREASTNTRNVALVAGQGEGSDRKTIIIGNTSLSGISRRELFVDARDISETDDNGNQLPDSSYNDLLMDRGKEKLTEYKNIKEFNGEVDTTLEFSYQRDFFMGDIVQLQSDFGSLSTARITEFIMSDDDNGISSYPTLSIIDEEVSDQNGI